MKDKVLQFLSKKGVIVTISVCTGSDYSTLNSHIQRSRVVLESDAIERLNNLDELQAVVLWEAERSTLRALSALCANIEDSKDHIYSEDDKRRLADQILEPFGLKTLGSYIADGVFTIPMFGKLDGVQSFNSGAIENGVYLYPDFFQIVDYHGPKFMIMRQASQYHEESIKDETSTMDVRAVMSCLQCLPFPLKVQVPEFIRDKYIPMRQSDD